MYRVMVIPDIYIYGQGMLELECDGLEGGGGMEGDGGGVSLRSFSLTQQT